MAGTLSEGSECNMGFDALVELAPLINWLIISSNETCKPQLLQPRLQKRGKKRVERGLWIEKMDWVILGEQVDRGHVTNTI